MDRESSKNRNRKSIGPVAFAHYCLLFLRHCTRCHKDCVARLASSADGEVGITSVQNHEPWPTLPREAIERLAQAERDAFKQLRADIFPYSPWNPTFVFTYVEINCCCAKLIEFLSYFIEVLMDAQAREYARYHPRAVLEARLLETRVAAEVRQRVNAVWSFWEYFTETGLMQRLQHDYWSDLRSGARDNEEHLLRQFESRREFVLASRVEHWRQKAKQTASAGSLDKPEAETTPEETEPAANCAAISEHAGEATPIESTQQARIKADTNRHQPSRKPKFPNRAAWLNKRLQERSWNKHDLARQGGPDHKTIQKILDGFDVREDVLEKIAVALSKKLHKVTVIDIPQD